jgi:hypothetical protein
VLHRRIETTDLIGQYGAQGWVVELPSPVARSVCLRVPRPQKSTTNNEGTMSHIQTGLDFTILWLKQLARTAKQLPTATTSIGSSLRESALKPKMRNSMPSPALPGSRSREMGMKNESTAENTAKERRTIIRHVQRRFSDFGRKNSFHFDCDPVRMFLSGICLEYHNSAPNSR